jgi:ABC-type Fe3+ transport system permease subunit
MICLLIIPAGFVVRGASSGFAVLAAHPSLMGQIGIALLFGITSGLFAWIVAGWTVQQLERPAGTAIAAVLLLPGLLGAWTLGLTLSEAFHTPMLRPLYETPLPRLLGEVFFQLPRAFLVRILLGRVRRSSLAHVAVLLGSAADETRQRRAVDLLWQLDRRGRTVGSFVVCYWATMELTIPSPSLLGPPGMTPAPVLLYNQMHYGQIPGLSALVLATIVIPVVSLVGLSLATRRIPVRLQPSADA